jgi:hypothetical protein
VLAGRGGGGVGGVLEFYLATINSLGEPSC